MTRAKPEKVKVGTSINVTAYDTLYRAAKDEGITVAALVRHNLELLAKRLKKYESRRIKLWQK